MTMLRNNDLIMQSVKESEMRLNNHVPHNLKKRYLKKHEGKIIVHRNVLYTPTAFYYKLIDILRKDVRVEREAHRYLQKRLRLKHVNKSKVQAFSGKLSCDFIWDDSEYGHSYWSRLNGWLHEEYPYFVSEVRKLIF